MLVVDLENTSAKSALLFSSKCLYNDCHACSPPRNSPKRMMHVVLGCGGFASIDDGPLDAERGLERRCGRSEGRVSFCPTDSVADENEENDEEER